MYYQSCKEFFTQSFHLNRNIQPDAASTVFYDDAPMDLIAVHKKKFMILTNTDLLPAIDICTSTVQPSF